MTKGGKAVAFLLGLIAGGLASWLQPYSLPLVWGLDYRTLLAVATITFSFVFRSTRTKGTTNTALYVGLGTISALLIRIIIDVVSDPSDHNEWLLEMVLFGLISFPCALIGAYLAELLQWTRKGRE